MSVEEDPLDQYIAATAARQAAAIEQACEQALTSGRWGVSVYRWTTWTSAGMVMHCDAGVDEAVPFGQIHEHDGPPPAPDAAAT